MDGSSRIGRRGWMPAFVFAATLSAACGSDSTSHNEFPPISEGTVVGTVTGEGGAPLEAVHVELTVPSQLDAYTVTGGGGISDAAGRFSVPVSVLTVPDPDAPPDTLGIYITATALPPRYTPPPGKTQVRDSVLAPVALAPSDEPTPVTEVGLTLPVAAASMIMTTAGLHPMSWTRRRFAIAPPEPLPWPTGPAIHVDQPGS
jgi:hypothetical protein